MWWGVEERREEKRATYILTAIEQIAFVGVS